MAEIDGEQYAARKLGCEISADPLNPLDPIKKVCKSHHPDEDLSILDRAYRRAVIQHSAQRRKSGEPYIIHPLAVSQILADLGMGPIVVAAGLLHDTVEDTDYTLDQCRAEFGDTVAGLVDGVTKLSQLEVGDSACRNHSQTRGGHEPRRAYLGGQARRPRTQRSHLALCEDHVRPEEGA